MKGFSGLPWKKGSRKRIVASRHFRVAFLMLLAISMAVYGLASLLFVFQTVNTLKKEAVQTANDISASVQDLFSATQANAVFVGSMKSVENLSKLSHPSFDDYMAMSSDLASFIGIVMYESIDIFLEQPRAIYVSKMGMYSFEDYPGRDLIELIENGAESEQWIVGREYKHYYKKPSTVATYLCRIPLYASQGGGYVAMNLSYRELEQLVRLKNPAGYNILLSYEDRLLYDTTGEFSIEDSFLNDALAFSQDRGELFVSSAGGTKVQCVCFVPRALVWQQLLPGVPLATAVFFLMVLIMALLAYLYSAAMLHPVDALMQKAGSLVDTGDEYDRLNSAFDRLSSELDSIYQQMQQDRPLIQDQIILELIGNYIEIPLDYEEQGICFPHDAFAVVVAVLPERINTPENALREPLKMIVRRQALEKFSAVGTVYSAYGEAQSLLFLINMSYSDGMKRQILSLCEPLAQELSETISMPVLFSVGICPKGERIPYRAYIQARRALSYIRDEDEGGVYLSSPNEYAPVIDIPTVNMCSQCVLDRNLPFLRDRLVSYFKTYLPKDAEIEEVRRFSYLIVCHVHARLLELDVQTDNSQLASSLKKLDTAKSYDDCFAILLAWFSAQMNIHTHLSKESYAYVRNAIQFIEEHYHESFTIPQIAQQVSVNPVYLNKLFKLSTGKTISEYLNSYRVERSKKMLLDGGVTVAAVSDMLGYNDVRSFIRFFKKFTGMTPNDYRQQNAC